MNISGSKKQLKLQLKSGDGKDEELLQDGEVSDLESVTTVRSTESQKTRRAIPKSSPSKRLVEFVTSQGVMTETWSLQRLVHIMLVSYHASP